MANTGDRIKTPKMTEDSKISAEEGEKLLRASGEVRPNPAGSGTGRGNGAGRWLRIRVMDIATGRCKASVQIPVGLVDAGMKIGAQFAPDVEGVDMTRVMDAIRAGATGKILDVTDDDNSEHVEISVE